MRKKGSAVSIFTGRTPGDGHQSSLSVTVSGGNWYFPKASRKMEQEVCSILKQENSSWVALGMSISVLTSIPPIKHLLRVWVWPTNGQIRPLFGPATVGVLTLVFSARSLGTRSLRIHLCLPSSNSIRKISEQSLT